MDQVLKTKRLELRPFKRSDIADFQKITDDYDVLKMSGTLGSPYTLEMATTKVTDMMAMDPSLGGAFAIISNQSLIGCITLKRKEQETIFVLGYHIGKTSWQNGYASEAVRAIIDWCFKNWDEHITISAGHFADNPASGRVLEKAGFIRKKNRSEVYCTTRGQHLPSIDYELTYNQWMSET